ncbi:uncharacterized [Tachysurus ichikawai]
MRERDGRLALVFYPCDFKRLSGRAKVQPALQENLVKESQEIVSNIVIKHNSNSKRKRKVFDKRKDKDVLN